MWRHNLGNAATLTATAVALSGCVVFASPPSAKQKKGKVVITVQGCASQQGGSPPPGSCSDLGSANQSDATFPSQVFLGFLIPSKSTAPASFSAKPGPVSGEPKLGFSPSSSYKQQLQSLDPAPSGEKWVGYRTLYLNYDSSSGEQNFTATVPFGLPKHFTGKFKYTVAIGGRATDLYNPNPSHAVNCMGSLTTQQQTKHYLWICEDASFSGSLKLK